IKTLERFSRAVPKYPEKCLHVVIAGILRVQLKRKAGLMLGRGDTLLLQQTQRQQGVRTRKLRHPREHDPYRLNGALVVAPVILLRRILIVLVDQTAIHGYPSAILNNMGTCSASAPVPRKERNINTKKNTSPWLFLPCCGFRYSYSPKLENWMITTQ